MTKEEDLKTVTKKVLVYGNHSRLTFEDVYSLWPNTCGIYTAVYPTNDCKSPNPDHYYVGLSGNTSTLFDSKGDILIILEGALITEFHKDYGRVVYQKTEGHEKKQGVMNLAQSQCKNGSTPIPRKAWKLLNAKGEELIACE